MATLRSRHRPRRAGDARVRAGSLSRRRASGHLTSAAKRGFGTAFLACLLQSPSASAQVAEAVIADLDNSDGNRGSRDYLILVGTFTSDIGDSDFGLYGIGGAVVGDVDAGVFSLGVSYDVSDSTSLRVGYLGLYSKATDTRPDPQDDRARVEVYWTGEVGDFSLQHRSRFEHRFRDIRDQTRYRPRIRATYRSDRTVSPFVSAELFYAFQDDDVQLLLGQAGLNIDLGDGWKTSGSWQRSLAFSDTATNAGVFTLSKSF